MSDNVPRLLQRENGYFYAVWFDKETGHTRRRSLGTKDSDRAGPIFSAFLSEFYSAGMSASPGVERADVLTCDTALFDYVQEHVEKKVVDKARIRGERGQYIEGEPWTPSGLVGNLLAHFSGVAVGEVSIPYCQSYADARRAGRIGLPSGDGTIRRELGCLVAAFNHEVRWRRLSSVDVPHVELPEKPLPLDRWLSYDELGRLMAEARKTRIQKDGSGLYVLGEPDRLSRCYRFVTGCYYTASRGGAIRKLDWFGIDFAERFVRLNPRGRRQTAKRRPTVAIDPRWMPDLKRAFDEKQGPHYLDHTGSTRKSFTLACERAGLPGVTPHVLRHTRIMHMLLEKRSLKSISDMTGDTIATLEANYIHAAPVQMREELEDAYRNELAENKE